jgi:hypothetical protein
MYSHLRERFARTPTPSRKFKSALRNSGSNNSALFGKQRFERRQLTRLDHRNTGWQQCGKDGRIARRASNGCTDSSQDTHRISL